MPQYPGFDIATFHSFFKNDQGRVWSNTFYWAAASQNLTEANINQGCQAFHTQLGQVITPLMFAGASLFQTNCRVFKQGGIVVGSYAQELIGDNDGDDALPLQDCLVIQKKTSTFGRSAMGRYFFSGLSEGCQTKGRLSDQSVNAAKALATFLGADRTFAVPFHARHWDRKNNVFLAIRACYADAYLKSRRDRQEDKNSLILA